MCGSLILECYMNHSILRRAIVRLRRMEKHHRDEAEALLETYKAALGLA